MHVTEALLITDTLVRYLGTLRQGDLHCLKIPSYLLYVHSGVARDTSLYGIRFARTEKQDSEMLHLYVPASFHLVLSASSTRSKTARPLTNLSSRFTLARYESQYAAR